MVRAVLTVDLGFDLAWCSSLSSEHLCIFGLLGAVLISTNKTKDALTLTKRKIKYKEFIFKNFCYVFKCLTLL